MKDRESISCARGGSRKEMVKQGDTARPRTHSKLFHVRHLNAKDWEVLAGKIKSKPSTRSSDDKPLQMGPTHHCSFGPISCYKGLKPQNCSQITHIYSELAPL